MYVQPLSTALLCFFVVFSCLNVSSNANYRETTHCIVTEDSELWLHLPTTITTEENRPMTKNSTAEKKWTIWYPSTRERKPRCNCRCPHQHPIYHQQLPTKIMACKKTTLPAASDTPPIQLPRIKGNPTIACMVEPPALTCILPPLGGALSTTPPPTLSLFMKGPPRDSKNT